MTRDAPRTLLAGRYELLESVGRGGMARVWKARMRGAAGFSRMVAIKRMLLDIARDPETVALFVEEARVGSNLSHPNIVQVLDFGADETGVYYLVLEWVDGLDLLDYMRSYHQARHHVPWQALAAIAYQALQGMGAAHERVDETGRPKPVIHRDITPSNILVGENGVVKLADFGLAKAMDRLTTTLPNIIKGKMAYTAPELAKGQKASVKSDIFSFGVTCWESLAGRQLFKGETALEVIRNIKAWQVPPLQTLRPDVPGELVEIVETAMAKDAQQRWGSAHDMARALEPVLRDMDEPVDAARLGYSVKCARTRLGKAAADIERAATEIEADALVSEVSVDVAFEETPASRRSKLPRDDKV